MISIQPSRKIQTRRTDDLAVLHKRSSKAQQTAFAYTEVRTLALDDAVEVEARCWCTGATNVALGGLDEERPVERIP